MGNYHMSIKNETPDYYSYCFRYHPEWEGIVKHGILAPYECQENGQREILTTVYVRYGQASASSCRNCPMLQRYYNGINSPHFFIRPIGDKIRLCCSKGGEEPWCDNLGALNRQRQREEQERRKQEEERRKREEEERRRRERIERERRIQEQISKEAEELKKRLGRAAEKRRLNTSLTGREQQHQRSHVLAQTVEDDAEEIKYEEEGIVDTKFQKLLKDYNIKIQSAGDPQTTVDIGERLKMLFDQLISHYCAEVDLSIWFHTSFDEATQFSLCSLTDKLQIVEALIRVILKDENGDLIRDIKKDVVIHEKHALLIQLMATLKGKNRSLSTHLLGNFLDAFAGITHINKEYIEMIVFNNIWTPLEAIILSMWTIDIPQNDLTLFLHMVQTYRVGISEASIAIKNKERLKAIQDFITDEEDKSLVIVIEEMRQNGVPETILQKVQQVVDYVVSFLPQNGSVDISDRIENGIQILKRIDFNRVDVSEFGQILVGLSVAVKQEMGYFPRVTQLVSVVTLLISRTSELNGCLLEISTGEGKSCIVAMLAVILALRGSTVDVVTSSPMLAIRDAEEWSGYFSKFNMKARAAFPIGLSKCKTPDEMDAVLASAYKANIVYGTVGNFAADTLRQEFEKKNIRGDRRFDAVIIDEVDYMTLDNGVQVTFLSHAASGMRHVEQVLTSIWNMVCGCRPVEDAKSGDILWFTNVQHFHKAVVSALVGSETNENFNAWEVLRPALNLGYITATDLKNLTLYERLIAEGEAPVTTKEHQQNLIDKIMSKIGILEARDLLTVVEKAMDGVAFESYRMVADRAEQFGPKNTKADKVRMLLLEKGLASEILTEEELVHFVKKAIEEKMKYSHEHTRPTKDDKSSDGIIFIPQILKDYVQNRLEIFTKNALKALLMKNGREYTIDRSAADNVTDSPPHQFDCIIPVDFKASGVLEKNKRWGDGLQQFLEMKHQLALTPLSTVTNYLSNFHFFKRYTNGSGVYGVSGTLGDKPDCAFLTKHFKVSCYPIPTHRHKKLVELPMVQVKGGEEEWIKYICQRTKAAVSAKRWCKGQAALIVCADMNTAKKLHSAVKDVCKGEKITLYTRSDKHTIEGMDFGPGHVIIATNLGGRGTDISVTNEVNRSGGLFVLLTHFPSNRRVERQICGRTARKGQPGVAQMVLNYHSLARAYQGQSVDTMRQLREEYERERIANMETDELLTVDIREKLFLTFCQRLSTLTGFYGGLEQRDLGSMKVCDVSNLLKSLDSTSRMDCKPAQNAFKETWAQWLILNEHRIENNENVNNLIQDLGLVLDQRQAELVQGQSSNFYDHTRQALGRMYLHEANHSKDCGTLAAWNRAIEADSAYKAIALYNKAYIIINMGKDGYMDEAIDLLKDTMKFVDVHVAETANTLMACNISSAKGKFEPHNIGETNFKRQLEIRNSFFKMWLDYTNKAIKKLESFKKDGEDAITEEKGIFALIEKPSHLEENELQELFNEGLQVVYEVKKKPRFCINALICAIIGVLQVFAGVLVCAVSFGSASQIGLGLISEGVSDIIAGVEGMITGAFDWAEWAISKAISIGMSLLSAGFSKIKDTVCAVAKGMKGLLTGAKSLSSVADDCLKATKTAWASTKTALSSTVGAMSKESFKQSVATLTSSKLARDSIKQAGKYVLQEVVSQGVLKGINVGISKGTEAMFRKLLSERFSCEVEKGFRDSKEINDCLTQLIVCYGVPETTLSAENPNAFRLPSTNETMIRTQIKEICERVVPELTTDNAVINELFSRLKEVKDEMEGILSAMDSSGKLFTAATVATEIGAHTAKFVTMIQNIPTKKVMQETVVPEFKEDIDSLIRDGDVPEYKLDARSHFATVQEMKEKVLKTLTQKVSLAFTDACASNLNSFLTDFARSKLNKGVTDAVHRTVGRYETNYFFQKQQEQYFMQKLKHDSVSLTTKPLSEKNLNDLTSRVQQIEDTGKAPSIVELKAMVASGQLGGKGLEIQTVDKDGTELSSVSLKGSNIDEGTIKLRIVREDILLEGEKGFFRRMKEAVLGKDSPWTGRFDLVGDDGKTIKLNTDDDHSIFYAVAMATHPGMSPAEVKEKAGFLRAGTGDEILKHPEKYVILHQRQKEYEAAYGESTFFSLPPKLTSGAELKRSDATVRDLNRSDANIVDTSFTLTRMKISLQETSTKLWTKLISGDEIFLKDILKASVSSIKNFATPVGDDLGPTEEDKYDSAEIPTVPGSVKLMTKKLLYLPSKDIIQECNGRSNALFSEMAMQWAQGVFVSMVIPLECEHQILASINGMMFGVSEKSKLYEVYRKLMVDCLCGDSDHCNPSRLLKLSMICSHPDSTLAILKHAGLLKRCLAADDGGLVKPEGLAEGEEIPADKDPRLGISSTLEPKTCSRIDGPWGLSDDGLDAYFKICFLVMLSKYRVANCLDEELYAHLVAWVEEDHFLDDKDKEYLDVLNAVKAVH